MRPARGSVRLVPPLAFALALLSVAVSAGERAAQASAPPSSGSGRQLACRLGRGWCQEEGAQAGKQIERPAELPQVQGRAGLEDDAQQVDASRGTEAGSRSGRHHQRKRDAHAVPQPRRRREEGAGPKSARPARGRREGRARPRPGGALADGAVSSARPRRALRLRRVLLAVGLLLPPRTDRAGAVAPPGLRSRRPRTPGSSRPRTSRLLAYRPPGCSPTRNRRPRRIWPPTPATDPRRSIARAPSRRRVLGPRCRSLRSPSPRRRRPPRRLLADAVQPARVA